MLTCDCFKLRMDKEEGLSFLEFNYMLLQAFDYLVLYRKYGCVLQVGGDDQWSNFLAGIDLIRRLEREEVYGMTFPLLESQEGSKMGKSEGNAVWLSPEMTSPYDFYQHWRNVDDREVGTFLRLYTFLPEEEINSLDKLKDQEINQAKKILACEVTKLVHGDEEARKAQQSAEEIFEKKSGEVGESAPSHSITQEELDADLGLVTLLFETGLVASKGQGRRLIEQGGAYLNEERVTDVDYYLKVSDFHEGKAIVRSGKKKHVRVILSKDD
jgi:tyrosyl-tRNA synthetase